jgi:MT0933-like antitoxin protein
MGLMDTIKGWFGGNKQEVKEGIDKGADAIKEQVPDQYDAQVDKGAEAAKDAVDKAD